MGEVFRARDSRLDRLVAIKVLTAARGLEQVHLDRFTREARAIARLNHPAICTLYDVGDQDGVPFLVMELLEGETLADSSGGRFRCSRTSPGHRDADRRSARRGARQGRDPSRPQARERDAHAFGCETAGFRPRKASRQRVRRWRDGTNEEPSADRRRRPARDAAVHGAEQIEGEEVDTRTDIFSFGVLLYEMITGGRPFSGSTRSALIAAIVKADPLPPSSSRPGISPALERAVIVVSRKTGRTAGRRLATCPQSCAGSPQASPACARRRG